MSEVYQCPYCNYVVDKGEPISIIQHVTYHQECELMRRGEKAAEARIVEWLHYRADIFEAQSTKLHDASLMTIAGVLRREASTIGRGDHRKDET